ncbi:V-type ATPase 116kDa subunit family protein [Trichomonas vaginalis G3]|uniref:V-type proton ATPase subunit a n=1 Tax=Trichomonas vaginalis (strain ATCC PRA-98 / G3) TaxID=412133 RepID=A2FCD4_TRIV3|nr:V-type proton ATPase subunit A family [Trichomonas vaginalis G3]EAX97446.1 V-type ATPase 116kDa subunit family protein [Trichomonas vaginalis G3]KAI5552004.1 V-type proton ATPase subunit A family [Trichomonas vaginalis G3]|eukprot:XP_001310376.1 V-type ATPase 116kDa subunit family protein [Trichomonas vaginalis G3]
MTKESSVFFPEEMQHIQLVVPYESAGATIRLLAEKDLIHLIDENTGNDSVNKRYTESYIHCEEAERCLNFIGNQLEQYDLLPPPITLASFNEQAQNRDISENELRQQIIEADTSLHERITRTQHLEAQLQTAEHTLAALRFYRPLLQERRNAIQGGESDGERSSAFEMELIGGSSFLFSITGVIDSSKLRRLLYTFYRISRGNVFSSSDISTFDDQKSFFTIWFPTESILRKLMNIAQSYGAEVFEFPAEDSNLDKLENELTNQIYESKSVLRQSYGDNKNFLLQQQQTYWFNRLFYIREKQIYQYLDFADFKTIEDRAIYKGWIAKRRVAEIQPLVDQAQEISGCAIHTTVEFDSVTETPPTYVETNSFTYAFQLFNDSYGVACHNEVNGGAFYCMYPFLFGIMFGDMGHSLLYLIIAISLLLISPKLRAAGGETNDMILNFRWFLFFMSICAFYCGFVYNECFGLPIDFFGSSYVEGTKEGKKVWTQKPNKVYPFGVDPVWMFKDNELTFTNSLKMKLAIIMGFCQMAFGMVLQFIKHYHRRDWLELCLSWLPQMLYMFSFFGYMVFLIIFKWCSHHTPGEDGVNLIQVLIGMLLSAGDKIDKGSESYLYPHQKTVQNVIALIFIITIPVLLFAKPIVEIVCHKGKAHGGVMEIFVMNLIDVIEFCLSMLSHTASYLRLWALSLAHSQLSHVLYEQIFILTLKQYNPALFFCGWAAFAVGTVVILLGMECFSSLLHAIRLMWVEFSSKFYTGQGYEFKPLSFKAAAYKIGSK